MGNKNINAKWNKSKNLNERILVRGVLELLTPTHLGNGDDDDILDMPLMIDEISNKPLLTGTSIAGAMRGYLSGILGANAKEVRNLFGSVSNKTSFESNLVVEDSICDGTVETELRDGVAINPDTKTALDKAKYDIELLEAGAKFELSFELRVPSGKESLVESLAQALTGFEGKDGETPAEIRLGKRKRRGFGACKVSSWEVIRYDVSQPQGVIDYLKQDQNGLKQGKSIKQLLGVSVDLQQYNPNDFYLDAVLGIDGSLLIRSAPDIDNKHKDLKKLPDAVQLRSKRKGNKDPKAVVSGTSLGGVIRSRALRICNTLKLEDSEDRIIKMFGGLKKLENKNKMFASRVWVEEAEIDENSYKEWVHTRVKIDRFTGGAYPGALFTEQPLFGLPDQKAFTLRLKLTQAKDYEVGLLLLILKDLWTGDLPIGGETSIGRGRLKGFSAVINYQGKKSVLEQKGDKLFIEQNHPLETYVQSICQE